MVIYFFRAMIHKERCVSSHRDQLFPPFLDRHTIMNGKTEEQKTVKKTKAALKKEKNELDMVACIHKTSIWEVGRRLKSSRSALVT